MTDVVLVYQPAVDEALPLAQQCARAVQSRGLEASILSSWNLEPQLSVGGARLALTFGGDGTILRAARWLAGTNVPIVGVQMGRLGFLAEMLPSEAATRLGAYLEGDFWLDRRAMLQVQVLGVRDGGLGDQGSGDRAQPPAPSPQPPTPAFLALNDLVVGRGQSSRTVTVDIATEQVELHQFRCDGLIVATATGSTAYSFAAGGPVLAPNSREMVLTPICPHISPLRALVVPGGERLRLRVWSSQQPLLTVDGQIDQPLGEGEDVEVCVSERETLFARRGTPAELLRRILSKLE